MKDGSSDVSRPGSKSGATTYKARKRTPGVPHPVDVHVGSKVRQRRTLLGMSQEKLGEALGLTFQQVQKYERGANRIGASRIYELSRILDVPVSYFFEDIPDEISDLERKQDEAQELTESGDGEQDPLSRRETLELIRAYYKVDDRKLRKRIFELVKTVAKQGDLED